MTLPEDPAEPPEVSPPAEPGAAGRDESAPEGVQPLMVPDAPTEDTIETMDPSGLETREDEGDQKKRKRGLPFWVEVPLLMVLALIIAVVIKTFLIQAFFIPSGSMQDTLDIDDRILVNKLAYQFGDPARGDVVVFDSGRSRDETLLESVRRNLSEAVGLSAPESDFIKRVVGLPGEEIQIKDNQVYIDGVPIAEPYLRPGTDMRDFGPELVPPDHFFMMGDHRNLSSDSRVTGPVHIDRFVGRAFVIVWPPGDWGGL